VSVAKSSSLKIVRSQCRGQFFAARLFKVWQVFADKLPENRRRNILVAMAKDVSNSRDLHPGDFRMPRFDVLRQVAAGFGDDLNPALNEQMPLPIGFQVVNRQIAWHSADTFGHVDHVVKP
jgi:hypothetical protein